MLHPEGGVSDLWAAMDPQYDRLYDSIPPFRYGKCLPYQDLDNEVSVFRGVSVHVQGQQEQQQQRQRSVQEPGAGVQGAAAAAASAAGGVTGAAGVGEGGAGQRQQSFVYRQADIEVRRLARVALWQHFACTSSASGTPCMALPMLWCACSAGDGNVSEDCPSVLQGVHTISHMRAQLKHVHEWHATTCAACWTTTNTGLCRTVDPQTLR